MSDRLTCFVYRSPRKVDTYLYLAEEGGFDVLPAELLRGFGPPEFCFELELTPSRRLAKEDPVEVITHLRGQGYHLQVQDDLTVEQMLALKSLN